MAGIEIVCVNKDTNEQMNFETITHYGWKAKDGSWSRLDKEAFIDWLEQEKDCFAYVKDQQTGAVIRCEVRERNGKKFLQSERDGKPCNNLLELDECPIR